MQFKDGIHTRTTINFSFADKLRVLIGRKVTVSVNVKTENVAGKTETESLAAVEKIFKVKCEMGGHSSQV